MHQLLHESYHVKLQVHRNKNTLFKKEFTQLCMILPLKLTDAMHITAVVILPFNDKDVYLIHILLLRFQIFSALITAKLFCKFQISRYYFELTRCYFSQYTNDVKLVMKLSLQLNQSRVST